MEKRKRRGGDLGLLIKTPAEIGHCLDNKKRGTFLSLSRSIYIYIYISLSLSLRALALFRVFAIKSARPIERIKSSAWVDRRPGEEKDQKNASSLSLSVPFDYLLSLSARAKAPSANKLGGYACSIPIRVYTSSEFNWIVDSSW